MDKKELIKFYKLAASGFGFKNFWKDFDGHKNPLGINNNNCELRVFCLHTLPVKTVNFISYSPLVSDLGIFEGFVNIVSTEGTFPQFHPYLYL